MRRFHYRHRVDANQAEIVQALRDDGCSVVVLDSRPGLPDIVWGKFGCMGFQEIKRPGGKLNKQQMKFFCEWNGPEIVIVETAEEALQEVERACRKKV